MTSSEFLAIVAVVVTIVCPPLLAGLAGLKYAGKARSPRSAFARAALVAPATGVACGIGWGLLLDSLPQGSWVRITVWEVIAIYGAAAGLVVGLVGGLLIAWSKRGKSRQ